MEPDRIAARMTQITQVALLRVHANPGTWRALPPAIRRSLRNEHLVHQNRDCEWVLTDTGHQVRKYLTFKENYICPT